jgi:mRNA-decapping enzyme subunit 2
MARLLSGLSLSAQQDASTPLPSLNMAAPHSALVETSISRPSSTKPPVSSPPSSHSHSASRENGMHDEPTHAHGAMGPQFTIAGKSESEVHSSPQTTPRSAALSSAWSASTTSTGSVPSDVPPRLAPSRQGGAHGDISPYLSRSTEIPTSGRRLKQLALLESVVDETTRRSAITRASTAMGMSDPTTRSLAPSASVPPSPIDARASPYPTMYNNHIHMTPSPNMPRAMPSTTMHPPGPPVIPLHEPSRPMHRPDASLEWNNGSQPWVHPRTHHQPSVYDQTPRQSFAPLPVRPNPGTLHPNGGQPSQGGFFSGVAPPHHMGPFSAPYGASPGRFGYADPPPPYADSRITSGYPAAPNTVPLLPARLAYPSPGAPTASTVNLLSILNSPLPSSVQYNPTRTPTNPP